MRSILQSGIERLAAVASPVFSNSELLERMIGLDQEAPGEVFSGRVSELLAGNAEIQASGLPQGLLERAAFFIAKERFEQSVDEIVPAFQAVFRFWNENAPQIARDGHNRALEKFDEKGERYGSLVTLHWTVEDGPLEGAILPDCVAVGMEASGDRWPLLMVEGAPRALLLPISSKKILVGRRSTDDAFDAAAFNGSAAAVSHRFFLAHNDSFAALTQDMGARTKKAFDKTINDALESRLSPITETESAASPVEVELSTFRAGQPQQLDFTLSLPMDAADPTFAPITEAVRSLIAAISPYLPLNRLEAIDFALDYAYALRSIDRGDDNLRPVETVSSEFGVGLASTVTVRRGDMVKARIVVQAYVAALLIDEDPANQQFAYHTLIYQLARVAYLDLAERKLAGAILSPITEPLRSFLFPQVDAAIQGYYAGFVSGPFSDREDIALRYRELLLNALSRLTTVVDPARIAYRYHADMDTLMAATLPELSYVLQFAGTLLGHCMGSGAQIDDAEGRLVAALRERDLHHWLASFGKELELWRQRAGAWESIDELLIFSRHTERLMWTVGMFPWETAQGVQIGIPLARDLEALATLEGISLNSELSQEE